MPQAKLAAAKRRQSHHVEAVFYGYRNAVQQTQLVPAHHRILRTPGRGAGLLFQQHHEGVDPRIVSGDLAKVRVYQFNRGNPAFPDHARHGAQGQGDWASTQTSTRAPSDSSGLLGGYPTANFFDNCAK